MSQAKVDRNKELRANRKQIVAREKRQHKINVCCCWLVALALVGWAGISAYNGYEANLAKQSIYTDLSALETYTNSLSE